MTHTQHTPGPWYVAYGAIYTTTDESGICIGRADRNESRTSPTERDANVALMASAPDLAARVEQLERRVELLKDENSMVLRSSGKFEQLYLEALKNLDRMTTELAQAEKDRDEARALLSRMEAGQ